MNPFSMPSSSLAASGLFLMAVGACGAALRSVPGKLWESLRGRFTITVAIQQTDPLFQWTCYWLSVQSYSGRCRALLASTLLRKRPENDALESSNRQAIHIDLAPSYGAHLFRVGKTWIYMKRLRDKGEPSKSSIGIAVPSEEIELHCLTTSREVVNQVLLAIKDTSNPPNEMKTQSYVNAWEAWRIGAALDIRPPDSIVLPSGQYEHILADLRRFYQGRQRYHDLGIPYRRGYLLEGAPGSGKSSLIRALAGEVGASLHVLNLAEEHLTDTVLSWLMSKPVSDNAFIIIEEMDTYFHGRDPVQPKMNVTMSGLLNALDGVSACEGRVLFMTTNYVYHLDPALIRPGRIDYRLQMSFATPEQIRKMFRRFHPQGTQVEEDTFAASYEGKEVTVATLQKVLYESTLLDLSTTSKV
jgi:chaperone BCS1